MRYNPDAWARDYVDTEALSIDLENPRFAFRLLESVDSIVQYLIENEDVIDLANKIVRYGGLYNNELIIVLRNGTGENIVLEGNRRTVACQLLLHPGKYIFDESTLRKIPEIDDELRNRISKIEASVVQDRRDADPVIANIHVFGKKEWNFLSKITYAKRNFKKGIDITTISSSLECSPKDVQNLIRCHTAIMLVESAFSDNKDRVRSIFNGTLDLHGFTKIVTSTTAQRYFGTPLIWDSGEPNFENHDDLIEKIRKISGDILFHDNDPNHYLSRLTIESYLQTVFPKRTNQLELDIRTPSAYQLSSETHGRQRSKDNLLTGADYLSTKNVPRSPINYGKISDGSRYDAKSEESIPQEEKKNRNRTQRFFENLTCEIPDPRLIQLTKEISYLSNRQRCLIDYPISSSFLMRALLEWSLLYHLTKCGKINQLNKKLRKNPGYNPSLSDTLRFCSDLNDASVFPKRVCEKCRYIMDNWIPDLNCNAHNDFGNSTAHRLQSIAADIRPIIKYIFFDHRENK